MTSKMAVQYRTPTDDEKSFRIKHDDDKFFSRLLSKETSKSNPSFRVYYGDVSSAVPFVWETRPGTPKHSTSIHDMAFVPPLTPPPSYYTTNLKNNSSNKLQSRSKLILHTLLRRMNPSRKVHVSPSPSSTSSLSSLSWSSSSHSSFSMMTPTTYKRRRFSSWGSSFDERASLDDHRDQMYGAGSRSCFAIGKKTLFSCIVGRRSA